jgi:transcriptional regulator with XRE-family HTH domain
LKLHLTQKELAEKSGVSTNSIVNYETGKRIPPYEILEKLSIAVEFQDFNYLLRLARNDGMDVDEILTDADIFKLCYVFLKKLNNTKGIQYKLNIEYNEAGQPINFNISFPIINLYDIEKHDLKDVVNSMHNRNLATFITCFDNIRKIADDNERHEKFKRLLAEARAYKLDQIEHN